jgi:hypothetical protein
MIELIAAVALSQLIAKPIDAGINYVWGQTTALFEDEQVTEETFQDEPLSSCVRPAFAVVNGVQRLNTNREC